MGTKLNPYISFRDNAKQAMEFYHSVFGGELTLSTFGENQASEDPAEQDKIMHGMLVTDSGLTLMGADTPSTMSYTPGDNYSVSLSGEDEAELRRYWDGSRVKAPLRCRSRVPPGVTSSGCALTSLASAGWSISPRARPRPSRPTKSGDVHGEVEPGQSRCRSEPAETAGEVALP